MAIQQRRGNDADFQPGKLLPGEFGISLDQNIVYMRFTNGVKRIALTDDLTREIASLSTNLTGRISTLEQNGSNELQRIIALESVTADSATAIAGHTSRITALESANTSKTTQISGLDASVRSNASAIASLQQRESAVESSLSDTADTVRTHTTKISNLESADTSIRQNIQNLGNTVTQNTNDIATLNSQMTTARSNITDLSTNVSADNARINTLTSRADGFQTQITNILAAIAELVATDGDLSDLIAILNSKLDAKADRFVVGEDGLLYVYGGDDLIASLGPFAGGGGGGGQGGGDGDTNNAVMSLRNTTGWIIKQVSASDRCTITFEWSSIEEEQSTGDGRLEVFINGTRRVNRGVAQGSVSVNLYGLLVSGKNTVRVAVYDTYENAKYINYTVTSVDLSITSEFDRTVAYPGAILFPYVLNGEAEKTGYFAIDGNVVETTTVTTSGRQNTVTLPAQSHGMHVITAWCTADIGGEEITSNVLRYEVICTESGVNIPIITSTYADDTAEQYSNIVIRYQVYTPNSLNSEVTLQANGVTVNTVTVDRTVQEWSYRAVDSGNLALTVTSGVSSRTWNVTVTSSAADIGAIEEGLQLYMTARNRSNGEANPGTWSYGNISATMTGFKFINDGWLIDSDGSTFLRLSNDCRVTIPFQIFGSDFRSLGKTITFDFVVRDVKNFDTPVISCLSGGRGIYITSNYISFTSEQSTLTADYKDEEHISITFTVESSSADRVILIFINGKPSGMLQYPTLDDFAQVSPVGITLGCADAVLDIYNIRVYGTCLTGRQVIRNLTADTQNLEEMLSMYDRNNIYNGNGEVDYTKLWSKLPYFIWEGARLPSTKGDKVQYSGEFVDKEDPTKSFTYTGAEGDAQGTTSSKYARKNVDMKMKNGVELSTGHADNYQLASNVIEFNRFVFKADMASSEGTNNVQLVDYYCALNPVTRPEQTVDPRVRWGIYGRPVVGFFRDPTTKKVTFVGKYNFNLPKRAPGPYGYSGDMESWEFELNATNLMAFKTDVFDRTMRLDPEKGIMKESWRFDYEARFPSDEWVNIQKLQEFQTFVYSTWRENATGNALAQSVTYEGVTYTSDTAAYRLAKFRAEFGYYAEVSSFVFYYIFTEFFLLADSREKNLFIGFSGSATDPTKVQYIDRKAVAEPYDMDTAIGTNNEGTLTFKYSLEDIDYQPDGRGVFNGQDSVLWNNVRDAFQMEIIQMYGVLRDNGLDYETVVKRFEDHQSVYPEAIWFEDAYYKYITTFTHPAADDENYGLYPAMLQGSKEMQRKYWLRGRFPYMDSKWNRGDGYKQVIQFRAYRVADLTLTPCIDLYPTVKYASYTVSHRSTAGTPTLIENPMDTMNDTEVYIYSAPWYSSIGDLSGFMVGVVDVSPGKRLRELIIGSTASGYQNLNMVDLTLGNNILLETIDCRNCVNLGGTAIINGTALVSKTPTIDASGCIGLKRAYFDNTSIKGLVIANGAPVLVIHVPSTITSLTLRNLRDLTDLTCPSFANLTTLWVENCSSAVDALAILDDIPANSRVRIIGFEITAQTYEDIAEFYDELDTMRGLDEYGNTIEKADGGAQVSGTIHIDSLTGAQYAALQNRYPYITIDAAHTSATLTYMTYDGTSTIDTETILDGGNGTKTNTSSKPSTAQYTYAPDGWATTINGPKDANALVAVRGDRTVYAAFTSTVRSYPINFVRSADDGGGTLQTQTLPYGSMPSYTGNTPTTTKGSAEDYPFVGFTPTITTVTGAQTYTAVFRDINLEVPTSTDVTNAYGGEWNYASSATTLTRTGLAASFSNPSPATSKTGTGSSPFDTIAPWRDMKTYNVENGVITYEEGESGFSYDNDTVVYIPEFYYTCWKDTTNSKWNWAISPTAKEGYVKHPGSGVYVGKYHTNGSSSGVYTKTGQTPLVSTSLTNFRTYSINKGSGWRMIDFKTWSAIQMLYLIEFADFHSQNTLGTGQNTGSIKTEGTLNGAAYHTVKINGGENMYRGIVNPFSNAYTWVDGFIASNRKAYTSIQPSIYKDTTTGYDNTGIELPSSNGYIKGFGYNEYAAWAFIPDAQGGSASTYVPDYVYSNTGVRGLGVGGGYGSGGNYGFFCFGADSSPSDTSTNLSSRLLLEAA